MKQLGLDGRYTIVTISDEAFAQVMAIVNANRVCGACGFAYRKETPQVALNLCLVCFQKRYEHKQLTYGHQVATDAKGEEIHLFLDTEGYVYYTYASSESEPQRSPYQTLVYWGYPVPDFFLDKGQRVELSPWYWHIYGDVRNNSVLYIEHENRRAMSKAIGFLTTRHGAYKPARKRSPYIQGLFTQAKENLEATRDEQGQYYVNGHEAYGVYYHSICAGVSELASAEHDKKEGT